MGVYHVMDYVSMAMPLWCIDFVFMCRNDCESAASAIVVYYDHSIHGVLFWSLWSVHEGFNVACFSPS